MLKLPDNVTPFEIIFLDMSRSLIVIWKKSNFTILFNIKLWYDTVAKTSRAQRDTYHYQEMKEQSNVLKTCRKSCFLLDFVHHHFWIIYQIKNYKQKCLLAAKLFWKFLVEKNVEWIFLEKYLSMPSRCNALYLLACQVNNDFPVLLSSSISKWNRFALLSWKV